MSYIADDAAAADPGALEIAEDEGGLQGLRQPGALALTPHEDLVGQALLLEPGTARL